MTALPPEFVSEKLIEYTKKLDEVLPRFSIHLSHSLSLSFTHTPTHMLI